MTLPKRAEARRLAAAFYLPSLLFALAQGVLIPVVPLYAGEFTRSYSLIGLVLAGDSLGMLLSDLPAGMLLRRLGSRRVMMAGLLALIGASFLLYLAPDLALVMGAQLLAGVGQAFYGVSRHAYIAVAVGAGHRGRAISLLGGLTRIGGFLGPALGGSVASVLGLRVAFLLYGGILALALTLVAALLTRVPQTNEVERGLAESPPPLAPPTGTGIRPGARLSGPEGEFWPTIRARGRPLLAAGIGQVLAQMVRMTRRVIVPLYAADVLGLDVRQIGFVLSLSSAVDMSLFFPAGWLMDRRGRKWAIVPSFAIQGVAVAMIPFTSSFAGLALVTGLIGLGNGFGAGAMMTLGADLAPPSIRGEFLGLWRLIGDIGVSGGPLLAGVVAQALRLPAATLALAGAGLLAALVFARFVPETRAAGD